MKCVILYSRLFERYEVFDEDGQNISFFGTDESWLDDNDVEGRNQQWSGLTEVPLNSKEGQRIVAKIGMMK